MNLKHFLLFGAAFAALGAAAQSLPGSCEAYMPRVLNSTTIFKADVDMLASSNYGQNGSTSKYWDVYSDRCDNPLYSSPGGSKNGKTLKFNQKVRIAQIKNNYALVYTENRPGGVNYPQISGSVTPQGWIPMDHLLLWDQCPTNQYGIYQKALIVYNIDEKDKNLGRISWNPDPANTTNVKGLQASVDFHYIMKTEKTSKGERYLVASAARLTGGTTEEVLEGWVSKGSFTSWNQRTCLEPNWDNDDVSYFVSHNEKANLYDDAKLTTVAQGWTFGEKNKEEQSATQYRMPPRSMRFPILDNDSKLSEKTFKITGFGTPGGGLGIQDVAAQLDEGRAKKEAHLNKIAHINIIVVMDATKSMNKFYPPMAKAIKEATQFLEGDVSVGVVLYRDYPDGNNKIEIHKMAKPSDASLQNFLINIGRNNYGANSVATTHHEAMYLGIKTALDYKQLGYAKDATNMVLIVGDCGNNPNDTQVTAAEITRMANEVNAQLFSFQVANQDKAPWEDFNLQLNSLFIDQMKFLYGTESGNVKLKWKPVEHGMAVRPDVEDVNTVFYSSETHRAQAGKELSEGELNALIQGAYIRFRESYENQKKAINNAEELARIGSKGDADLTTVGMYDNFLRRRLGADYKSIITPSSLLAYTGYARQDDGNGRDYWQAVIFLSSEELIELIKRLEPLKVAVKTNTYTAADRSNYVKAITGIIQSMTEKSADEIDQMSTDDITRIIGGLNATTPMLRGKTDEKVWTLAQIRNPQACPDEEFKKILKRVAIKIDNLSQLPKSANFKYSFTQNNHTYYWVPLTMIP